MRNLGNKGDTSAIVLAIIAGAIIIAVAIWLGFYYQVKFSQPKTNGSIEQQRVQVGEKPTSNNLSADKQNSITGNQSSTLQSSVGSASGHSSASTSNSNTNNKSDEELIKQALLDKTGINPADFMFDIADNNGTIARGTVKDKNDIGGAGWFAHKSNGVWTITYVGQGVPKCSEVNPYGYPVSWADYCLNSQGKPVHR